jgi:indolepyruvate ferredoxin oxidoreductase, beta subunit
LRKRDFLFVGVGGQGIILASDVVAELGLRAGYDVKKSEIHGMSQRGGSVESFVRWGDRVRSPIAEAGTVDYLVCFELLEAARSIQFLAPGGVAVLNRQRILPLAVAGGGMAYPTEGSVVALLAARGATIRVVDAMAIALELGNPAVVNVVLLGELSKELDIEETRWLEIIAGRVPERFGALNQRAFLAGRASRQVST